MENIKPIFGANGALRGFAYERDGKFEAWRRDDATEPARRIHTYAGNFDSIEQATDAVLQASNRSQRYKDEFTKICPECRGSGRRRDDEDECPICMGTGRVSIDQV